MLRKVYHKMPVWVLYTLFFIGVVATSFGILHVMGQSTIWNLDGIAQHFPILNEFYQILRGTAHQSLFSWSWNLGLGADQMTTFSYYVVGDPFNYLIALFPPDKLELGYQVLTLLRLYAVGLAFLALARQLHFKRLGTLIGALIYTFNGYSFYVAYHHPFFLMPLIFFPLLCLCIERVYAGKSFLPLVLTTAIALVCNVYFAYLLGLGALLFALIRYFDLRRKQALKTKLPTIILAFLTTIIVSVLMAAIILLPNILAMLNSSRTGGATFANGLLLYPKTYYLNLPNSLLNTSGTIYYWAVLGTSGLTLCAMVWTLRRFKQYLWLNVTLILIGLGLLFPAVAATMNVLSTPSNRWILLAHLVFALTAALFVDHLQTLTTRDYGWFGVVSTGLLALVWVGNGFTFNMAAHRFLAYGFLLIFIILLVAYLVSSGNKTGVQLALLITVALNAASTGIGLYSANYNGAARNEITRGQSTKWAKAYFDYADRYLNQLDTSFYRTSSTSNYYTTPTAGNNMPMLLNTHNIGSYYSVQNGKVNDFNKQLENVQNAMNNPTGEVDDRTTMNALLGVKYLFARQDTVASKRALPFGYRPVQTNTGHDATFRDRPVYTLGNGTGTVLLKSDYALPLAYMQYNQLDQTAYQKLSAENKEQALLQGVQVAKPEAGIKKVSPTAVSRNVDYSVKIDSEPLTTVPRVINYRLQKNIAQSISALPFNKDLPDKQAEKYRATTNMKKPGQRVSELMAQNQNILDDNNDKNRDGLTEMTSDTMGYPLTYRLKIDNPKAYQNYELYLDIAGIKTTSPTTAYRMQSFANKAVFAGKTNFKGNQINQRRYINDNPVFGNYRLNVATNNSTNTFLQLGVNNMSDYEPTHHLLFNLGYSSASREYVKISFDTVRQMNFKHVKIVAVPLDATFKDATAKLQSQGLKNLQVKNNRVTGQVENKQAGILTTSIPYSTGWQLQVDGKTTPTQVVNTGFVGARVNSGNHKITLTYKTPGLKVGGLMSLAGLALFVGLLVIQLLRPKRVPRKRYRRRH